MNCGVYVTALNSKTLTGFQTLLGLRCIPAIIAVLCAVALCSCNKAEDRFIEDEVVVNEDENRNKERAYQNQWTYAQMQEHYLWEEYMPDSASVNFTNSPTAFFDKLIYKGDRFSWIERNTDYSGNLLYDRFGVETVAYLLPAGGKVYRTALVLPHSPAKAAGLRRGDWFIMANPNGDSMEIETGTIDGTSFMPAKKISLSTSETAYTDAVMLDTIYQLNDQTIGYLVYNSFHDEMIDFTYPYRTELMDIFGNFRAQGITDLIIDLRYNRGGYVSIKELICGLILPDEYMGEIAGYQAYNKTQAAKLLEETGNEEVIRYFPKKSVVENNNVALSQTYFIITGRTASASESLIYSLAPCINVVTVGSTSTGKNVGSYTLKDRHYEWQLQPVTFYFYNREHTAVPETGIVPDFPVNENNIGIWYELGDTRELLLSVALEQITGDIQLRSAAGYSNLLLTPTMDDEREQRRKVEGLIKK